MTTAVHADTGDLIEITGTHPVADLFPLLLDDDLKELSADVKSRGLVNPLLVTTDGVLMDGRNRLAACDKASVKPTATVYYGDDPVGLILALNVTRRHMSKGQLAVVAAEVASSGSKTQREAAPAVGVSNATVGKAAVVIDHAPEMVADVKAGTTARAGEIPCRQIGTRWRFSKTQLSAWLGGQEQ